ncbi:hypothetical protein H5410_036239 [Solanum commersonii]|uniref:Uncharacterized protein n=1 Tax=Solanum commersonii TaxID=4109 RepID=A0A9J5Y532_SOLCO|nr:hypothetical protein H5410_036239 [Solanum commersonii]
MNWCCEECNIGKGIMSSSHGLEIVQFEGSSTIICQSAMQQKKRSKFPRGSANCTKWEKEVKTGKERYIHVEKAFGLPSGIDKDGSSLINIVSQRVMPTEYSIMTQGKFLQS